MNTLIIEETKSTPSVFFNVEKGILTITGKSLPENSLDFYKKIERSLDEFVAKKSGENLIITCEFEYINTSSSKALYNILRKAYDSSENTFVIWCYEEDDEDMLEQGQTFQEALGEKFEFRVFVSM